MSFVMTHPEALAAATGVAIVRPSTVVADEISALTARQFSAHAATYETVGTQAMVVDELFTGVMRASAGSYAAETTNAIAAS